MLFPYSRSELQRIFSVLLIRLGEGDDAKHLFDHERNYQCQPGRD